MKRIQLGKGITVVAEVLGCLMVLSSTGCGARTGLLLEDRGDTGPHPDGDPSVDADSVYDAEVDASFDAFPDVLPDGTLDADEDVGCIPVDDRCSSTEQCGNGEDDDCDDLVDEECLCEPGEVQECFVGPPGRRGVGACVDGSQTCEMSGSWGPCTGGIWPRSDVCNGLDNQCNGCSELDDCEIDCPGPEDPRVVDGAPFNDYELRGRDFYPGLVRSWLWEIIGGPCDVIAPRFNSFELRNHRRETAIFHPLLSGDYRVILTVVTEAGTSLTCEWLVTILGPGLRVEMCYPESEFEDLDLFVKQPGAMTPWYPDVTDAYSPSSDQCGWHNCEAIIRGVDEFGREVPRADWGYADSDISECEGGPLGDQWRALGYCANPRLDIDNNLSEGTGLPENINIDSPRNGELFRIMVQNFTGGLTQPLVNVYCGGRRVATFGSPPDIVPDFLGAGGYDLIDAMWRVADITTFVDATGEISCAVQALHPPGMTHGYDVTHGNVRY